MLVGAAALFFADVFSSIARQQPLTSALVLALASVLVSCKKPAPFVMPPPEVAVIQVTPRSIEVPIEIMGTIEASRSVQVRSQDDPSGAFSLDVSAPSDGFVVLSEVYFPERQAWLDGSEVTETVLRPQVGAVHHVLALVAQELVVDVEGGAQAGARIAGRGCGSGWTEDPVAGGGHDDECPR